MLKTWITCVAFITSNVPRRCARVGADGSRMSAAMKWDEGIMWESLKRA